MTAAKPRTDERRCGYADTRQGHGVPCRRRVLAEQDWCTFHVAAAAASGVEGDLIRQPGWGPMRRCRARTRRDPSKRCGRPALRGGWVCRQHGGAAPQTLAKAQRRLSLAAEVARSGRLSPGETLLSALHRLRVVTERCERELPVPPGAADVLAYVDLLEKLIFASRAAVAAGVEEKLVADATAHGEKLITMLTALLDWTGVGDVPELAEQVGSAMPAILRGGRVPSGVSLFKVAVEARVQIRLEEELRRRAAGGQLAIADRAESAVSGPQSPVDGPQPGVGAEYRSDGFGAVRGVQPDADVSGADEVVDAEVIDDPLPQLAGRDPRRCPACAQDRFAPGHDARCGWNEVQSRMSLYSPLLGR